MTRTGPAGALLLATLALSSGCASLIYGAGYRVGIPFLYREAELPLAQMRLDVPYLDSDGDGDAVSDKHRLDLFLPSAGDPWPLMIFVHGGGWTSGDRAYEPGGYDVYRNIGRFFAARGVGVAVISYRLQPAVSWREQVDDVRAALRWAHANARRLGADPESLFLAGHSAGAHLASYVALDENGLGTSGVSPSSLCGLIPVSGAALDLTDARTWELGEDRGYYEERFRDGDDGDGWLLAASPAHLARGSAPPSLILYGGDEPATLKRQSEVLYRALREAGAASELAEVPGQGHQRIVLTLSREDRSSAPAILEFIRARHCGGG